MDKKGPGRPKNLELITVDQAVEYIKARLIEKYNNNLDIVEKLSYKKKTIQNMMSLKRISRFGDNRCPMLDKKEVEEKLVG